MPAYSVSGEGLLSAPKMAPGGWRLAAGPWRLGPGMVEGLGSSPEPLW